MYVDPVNIFGINIACNIRSSVNNKTLVSVICGKTREGRTIKACTYDQEVIFTHINASIYLKVLIIIHYFTDIA